MSKKNQHVVPRQNGWAVIGEGNQKASSVHETQKEAIGKARDTAKQQKTELLVHGKDGHIRARDSYGKDPYPPKG